MRKASGRPPEQSSWGVRAYDLGIMLNNGLDNAIEAIERMRKSWPEKEAYITVKSYVRICLPPFYNVTPPHFRFGGKSSEGVLKMLRICLPLYGNTLYGNSLYGGLFGNSLYGGGLYGSSLLGTPYGNYALMSGLYSANSGKGASSSFSHFTILWKSSQLF